MGFYIEFPPGAGGPQRRFLPHRLAAPRPYAQITRHRLLDVLAGRAVVVLSAPSGYGKTTLAGQLAAAWSGPLAWFTAEASDADPGILAGYLVRAVESAWQVTATASACHSEDDLAALEDVLGGLSAPGCLVVDDVDTPCSGATAPVLAVVLRCLPAGIHLVLAGRADPPVDLLKESAAGVAATVRAEDLRFSPEETAAVLDLDPVRSVDARDVHEHTGGWPLAVGLAASNLRLRDQRLRGPDLTALGEIALRGLSTDARPLLALASRVPRAPVVALGTASADAPGELARLAEEHPSLLALSDDGWCAVRDVVRGTLASLPVPTAATRALAAALEETGEVGLALDLLVGEKHWDEVAALLRRAGRGLLDAGGWEQVRTAVAALPAERSDAEARLLDATAAVHAGAAGTDELRRLRAEMWEAGVREGLWASVLLANHLFHTGDAAVLAVLLTALAEACGGFCSEDALRSLLAAADEDTAVLASYLTHLLGVSLRFVGSRDALEQGRRLTDVATATLERAGADTVVARAVVVWVEASSGSMDLAQGIAELEATAAHLRRRRSPYRARLQLGLGILHLAAGDVAAARAATAEARATASPPHPEAGLVPTAEAVLALCDVVEGRGGAAADSALEAAWEAAAAGGGAVAHRQLAALVALTLLAAGDAERARRWAPRARTGAADPMAGFEVRLVDALTRVAGGEADPATELAPLVAWCEAAGLDARAERLRTWAAAPTAVDVERDAPCPLAIRVLAPEIRVERDGAPGTVPRGIAGRLLGLLVAERGPVEIDRVIETLWPDSNPDLGRNRLYGVVHRLRGALGLDPAGPLRIDDGLVRLDPGGVRVDAWDLLDALPRAGAGPVEPAVLDLYEADFCASQLAYDDFAIEARRSLRTRFLTAARRTLGDALTAGAGAAVEALAARVCDLAPDDEDLALLAVRVHTAEGNRGAARTRLATAAAALADLGLPTEGFRAAAEEALDARRPTALTGA